MKKTTEKLQPKRRGRKTRSMIEQEQLLASIQELDRIKCDILATLIQAKEVQSMVSSCVDIINTQTAETGTDRAVMLYQCKQESYFTKLHADGVVDSLDYLSRRFTTMKSLFEVEAKLRTEMQREIERREKK